MNIPVSNFGRDEAYTFIHGIAVAAAWYLYLVRIEFISTTKSMLEPFPIMLWLLSTAMLYIVYLILSNLAILHIDRILKKQSDDDLVKEKKLIKYISLYFSGPLEESRTSGHVLGLMTASLFFLYPPSLYFFLATLKINFLLIHFAYSGLVIFVYYLFYRATKNLLIINRLIANGLCDTIDEKAYNKKRADLYAEIKNNDYLEKLGRKK